MNPEIPTIETSGEAMPGPSPETGPVATPALPTPSEAAPDIAQLLAEVRAKIAAIPDEKIAPLQPHVDTHA